MPTLLVIYIGWSTKLYLQIVGAWLTVHLNWLCNQFNGKKEGSLLHDAENIMEILIAVAGLGLILLWKRLAKGATGAGNARAGSSVINSEARNLISLDDQQIRVTYPNGEARSIRWADLTMVGIRTTDEGPFLPDVFWVLQGVDQSAAVVYHQGASGDAELLKAMQMRLDGFDNQKVIEAMGRTDHAFFLVWERKDDCVKSAA